MKTTSNHKTTHSSTWHGFGCFATGTRLVLVLYQRAAREKIKQIRSGRVMIGWVCL